MSEFVQHPVVQALAWALVHFLWQGALIALAAFALMRAAGPHVRVRYGVGIAALLVMIAAPAVTFVRIVDDPYAGASSTAVPGPAAVPVGVVMASPPEDRLPAQGAVASPASRAPWLMAGIVVMWVAGVAVFLIRLTGGWLVARRLARRAVQPAAAHIQALAATVADRLNLGRAVTILESSTAVVPVLVGWLQPTVVLPAAALAGLSLAQIEALIAHELAHVRRHDFAVNVLQAVVEAVLFYHPAVWWLSRRVRADRELCCDDLAVSVCDRLTYATALADLAAMSSPRLALAATDGDLLGRVRRVLGQAGHESDGAARWVPVVLLAIVMGAIGPVALMSPAQAEDQRASATAAAPAPPLEQYTATLTLAGNVSVQSLSPGVPVEMRLGNNAVQAERIVIDQSSAQQAAAQQAERARREEELKHRLELEAARAREAEAEVLRVQVERMRRLFEVGMASSQQVREAETALALALAAGDTRAQREIETEALRRHLADLKLMAEVGTVHPNSRDIAEVEARLAQLQAGGDVRLSLEAELKLAERRYERSRALFEKGLISSTTLAEAEVQVARLRSRIEEVKIAEVRRQEVIREERARLDESVKVVERDAFVDPARPIAAGDALSVVISGEPDLPSSFTVKADGTIRLPLLGTFKVAGQTTAEVRAAIGKQLADRRLGSASQVTVTVRRVAR